MRYIRVMKERSAAQFNVGRLWLTAVVLSVFVELFFCSAHTGITAELGTFLPEPSATVPLTSLTLEHIDSAIQLLERIFVLAS